MKIIPSNLIKKQLRKLNNNTLKLLTKKIELIKHNPFRYKTLQDYKFLFRIRFKDQSKEKRLIYQIKEDTIILLFILNRKHDYKDLKKCLEKVLSNNEDT